MSFFQNPFPQEFKVSLPFSDRQYSLTFSVPANRNQSTAMISWNNEPYDLSTYNTLSFNFAIDKECKNFATVSVNVAGSSPSATTVSEIVTLLNADSGFSGWFTAYLVDSTGKSGIYRVGVKAKLPPHAIKVYVSNTGAEKMLRFNKHAGVAELPTYCERHTIDNRFTFDDSQAALILLDESDATYDQPIITAAGFDYSAMKEDWQLLRGRVGLFNFQKITVDGSDRITEIIEYPAGALAGDLARKINYSYDSANTKPSQITEIPYTLQDLDLVTP